MREGKAPRAFRMSAMTLPRVRRSGIIGGTGSSKTTLVQLIPRLYDVTGGTLSVGGCDVRDYDIKTLRDSVAVVLQKTSFSPAR